jgi:uncharacterized protein
MSPPTSDLPVTVQEIVQQLQLIPHPEGGFFVETFRSGAPPMRSQGTTDFNTSSDIENYGNLDDALIEVPSRKSNRADKKTYRNALTSIYWVPTVKSPVLALGRNCSDHVHYYQGGLPFEYITYDPLSKQLRHHILGPDILGRSGGRKHQLQVCVPGGVWKCGRLCLQPQPDPSSQNLMFDYCK